MPAPQPSIGRIVLYRLTEDDAQQVTQQRAHTGTTGNPAEAGQQYPAVIVQIFYADACNLRVLLDGQDPPLWATSRSVGEGPGTWAWPERV